MTVLNEVKVASRLIDEIEIQLDPEANFYFTRPPKIICYILKIAKNILVIKTMA